MLFFPIKYLRNCRKFKWKWAAVFNIIPEPVAPVHSRFKVQLRNVLPLLRTSCLMWRCVRIRYLLVHWPPGSAQTRCAASRTLCAPEPKYPPAGWPQSSASSEGTAHCSEWAKTEKHCWLCCYGDTTTNKQKHEMQQQRNKWKNPQLHLQTNYWYFIYRSTSPKQVLSDPPPYAQSDEDGCSWQSAGEPAPRPAEF